MSLAMLVGVAVLAFALRLAHLLQARSVVFFELLISDGKAYTEWAARIAGGDWLGEGVFYQAPMYPYFLAVAKLLVGDDLFWIRFVQIILGSVSCAMLAAAGAELFGRRAGLLAGMLLAVYPPAIYFDALIQKAVLSTFWMTMLLWSVARAQRRCSIGAHIGVGAALAALVLTVENSLLFVPVLAIWIVASDRAAALGRRFGRLAGFGLGATAVLLPVGIRNQFVGGEFALTTSQAGPNFYIGNNPLADGSYRPLRPGRSDTPFERVDARELAEEGAGRSLSPREVSRYWFGRAFDFIRDDPGTWMRLLIRKFRLVFNVYEIPDAEDLYFYAERCSLIRRLGVVLHFGVICPLGLAGIVATSRTWRRTWVLIALLATIVAGLVAFYVFSRYRFPMVPILILFAAAGLVVLPRMFRERNGSRLGIYAMTLAVTAVLVNWRMFSAQKQMGIAYANAGAALADAGRLEEAIDHSRTAVRLRPDMAEAHFNLGEALLRGGDVAGAADAFRNSAQLEPNDPDTHYKWGNALSAMGQFDAAADRFRASLALRPADVDVMNNLAVVLMQGRRYGEAVDAFEQALALSPDRIGVAGNLAWLLATCEDRSVRDAAKAVRLAEHACDLSAYKDANLLDTLATAYAEAGRFADAARIARKALEAARAAKQEALASTLERKITEYDARR